MPILAADGRRLAVLAEVLYLANLLALPGFAFLALALLWRRRQRLPGLAREHLRQTFSASLWALGLLVGVNGAALLAGGVDVPATWVFVLLYFLTLHSALVMLGVVGLARALGGRTFRYPLVGVAAGMPGDRCGG